MAAGRGSIVIRILGDTSGLNGAVNDADGALGKLGGSFKKIAGVAAAAFGGIAVGGFLKDAVGGASDLNESLSKVTAVFGKSAGEIDQWAKDAAVNLGLSRGAALDAAGGFGNLFDQLGFTSKEATTMSKEIVNLSADFASFHNADISEVIEAQSAAFRGEYDSLQKFLPLLNAAAVEEKALEMTTGDLTITAKAGTAEWKEQKKALLAAKGALTAQNKALAVQTLMMEGAGVAAGDFARTSDGLANKQRILAARIENIKTSIGAALLPMVLKLTDIFANALEPVMDKAAKAFETIKVGVRAFGEAVKFGDVTSNGFVGQMETLGDAIHKLIPTFQRIAETGRKAFAWVKEFIDSNPAPVFAGLGAIVLAAVVPPFVAWAAATLAAILPVVAITVAIGALVGGIVYAYQHFESFRDAIETIATTLTGIAGPAFDAVKTTVSTFVKVVLDLWGRFGKDILDFTVEAWMGVVEVARGVTATIKGIFELFAGIFTGDWKRVWEGLKEIFDGVWDTLIGVIRGAILGIADFLIQTAGGVISAAWSTVWHMVHTAFNDAWALIAKAITNAWDGIVSFFTDTAPGAISTAAVGMFDGIKEAFKSVLNWIIRAWNGLEFTIPGFDPPGPGPKFGGFTLGMPDITELGAGGIVQARAGGGIFRLGEAGRDEAVIPLDGRHGMGGTVINNYITGALDPVGVARQIQSLLLGEQRRSGPLGFVPA